METLDQVIDALVWEGDCLVWRKAHTESGYGRVLWDGRLQYVHRLIYAETVGAIPDGMLVRHKVCDNPPCANPEHLLLGTYADNNRDRSERGRTWLSAQEACSRGHRRTEENTKVTTQGGKVCKDCQRGLRKGTYEPYDWLQ